MTRRLRAICKSIIRAITSDVTADKKAFRAQITSLFSLLNIVLAQFKWDLWRGLRAETWDLDEREYRESFRIAEPEGKLMAIGDLGYSGSTFFTTPDSKFLIKSLPRRFEYSFFEKDLLEPYCTYMRDHPKSLLVRILDYLHAPYPSLGRLLKLVPTHHIVMENALYGKESDDNADAWETYDLKPLSYFYPERDILNGALATEETLSQLADKFEDKMKITKEQWEDLKSILETDTQFLAKSNTVDYSLFVVRCPPGSLMKSVASETGRWREGVTSSDGKWKYRMVLLDFFWAKHMLFPRFLTGTVRSFNFMAKKGRMSITTNPSEYRNRFLTMVDDIVEVHSD